MITVAGVRGIAATAALLVATIATQAGAQGGALITGKVTNEQGAPLVNANVFAPSLNVNALTNAAGTYSLAIPAGRATGQQVGISARFIGYVRQNRQVTLSGGTQSQDFVLKSDPLRLEEVVVTGVAEATSSRLIPFSVAKISEEQLKQVPASSPVAALAGKVSGVRVALGNGNPGSAPAIRLRGSTSLGIGSSSPLIIVDGVVTKSNISDIDANDIASIEVLKGAAAASFYGSDAANGVVNITTKRGKDLVENKLDFQVRSEYGKSGIANFIPLNKSHGYVLNPDGSIKTDDKGSRTLEADRIADNPFPTTGPNAFRDQLKEWLTDGDFYSANIQMGLRRGNTNFNTSYTNDHNQGILPLTSGQFRQNMRLNVDQGISDKLDFSASVTYGIGRNDYPGTPVAGQEDTFFGLLQAPPDLDLRKPNGDTATTLYSRRIPTTFTTSNRGNPLYVLANEENLFRRERMLGSFSARYRPTSWLNVEGSYGTDRLNRRDSRYEFRGFQTPNAALGPGRLRVFNLNNVSENSQINATASKSFFNNVQATTRVAYSIETTENRQNNADGTKLNITNVPDLAALDPAQNAITSQFEETRGINYQASQNFTIKERYIIDAQVRRDASSLFGPESRHQNFYRIAGAYVLSEDFKMPGIQEFKLRAARGTAGLRPAYDNQYETYDISQGQLSKLQLGNKALKPAIQTENEFGVNMSFLDRFSLEVVQANRDTKGAFIDVPLLAAASGGFTRQIQNAADVAAKTTELSFQASVINRPNLSYSFGITGDHTSQRITRLARAPFVIREDQLGQGQGIFYYKEGEPLGIIYGSRWVRSFAELKQNPANAAAIESNYVVNPLGFLVLAANRGKINEAPIAFVDENRETKFNIGDVNPDYSFGFSNNLRAGNFGLYALFDGQQGGKIYNFTKQWMFQDLRHGDEDMAGKPADQQIAQPFFTGNLYNGLQASDHFVEDGSYVKLRELSFSYDLGTRQLERAGLNRYASNIKLALIGRNLKTWTKYTGFDPEVTAGSDFNFRVDGFRYPQFRTITAQVTVGF